MIIDTDDYSASGIQTNWYPAGEPYVKIPSIISPLGVKLSHVHIYAKIRSAQDLVLFLAVCAAYTERGIRVHVFMPYLPAGRQDRLQEGMPNTSALYAMMIMNSVHSLVTLDVHSHFLQKTYSDLAEGLNVTYKELSLGLFLEKAINPKIKYDAVVRVDQGASNRAALAAQFLQADVVRFEKSRNPEDGQITVKPADGSVSSSFRRILVVDDICDGGATFITIAKYFPYAKNDLIVTHGIFSKGVKVLEPFYENIVTSDSFCDFITGTYDKMSFGIVPLLPLYLESLSV